MAYPGMSNEQTLQYQIYARRHDFQQTDLWQQNSGHNLFDNTAAGCWWEHDYYHIIDSARGLATRCDEYPSLMDPNQPQGRCQRYGAPATIVNRCDLRIHQLDHRLETQCVQCRELIRHEIVSAHDMPPPPALGARTLRNRVVPGARVRESAADRARRRATTTRELKENAAIEHWREDICRKHARAAERKYPLGCCRCHWSLQGKWLLRSCRKRESARYIATGNSLARRKRQTLTTRSPIWNCHERVTDSNGALVWNPVRENPRVCRICERNNPPATWQPAGQWIYRMTPGLGRIWRAMLTPNLSRPKICLGCNDVVHSV